MHIKISRYLALLFVKEVPKLILFACSQQRPKLIILIGSFRRNSAYCADEPCMERGLHEYFCAK